MITPPSLPSGFFDKAMAEVEAEARQRSERQRALYTKNIAREERIVAWIDILGFSERLLQATTDEEYFAVYRVMLRVHDEFGHPHANADPAQQGEINRNYGRTVLALSDGLIVTAAPTGRASQLMPTYALFLDFIQDLMWAQANCAASGIFLRGGISIGPYYYDDDILLSPALVRAYKLETKRAYYPVIIMAATELDRLAALPGAGEIESPGPFFKPFKSPAQKRGERFFFIDYLDYLRQPSNHGWFSDADRKAWIKVSNASAKNRLYDRSHKREAARFMRAHKDHILKAFHSTTNARVQTKYRWLMKYQNRALQGFPNVFASARF